MKKISTIFLLFFFSSALYAISSLNNNPDPFAQGGGGSTSITYDLSVKSDLTVGIYNDTGNLIKNLYVNNQTTGSKSVNWDGTNKDNVEQSAGLYKAYVRQRMNLSDNLHIESNESFSNPMDIAVDKYGNAYIADYGKHQIHKISKTGAHLWVKGSFGSGGSVGNDPQFAYPRGIAVDSGGYIYVADQKNNRIQKLDSSGKVVSLSFINLAASGYTNGTHQLRGLDCTDTYLYVTFDNDIISTGLGFHISIIEYLLSTGAQNTAYLSGNARGANNPKTEVISDIAVPRFRAGAAPYYVLATNPDESYKDILSVSSTGVVTQSVNNYLLMRGITIGTTISDSYTVYSVETTNNTIVKYMWNGTTVLTNLEIYGDTEWPAGFSLNYPAGIAIDSINKNLWVTDRYNNRIVCFNETDGSLKFTVNSDSKSVAVPKDLDVDVNGYLYVADYGNNRIHKFDRNGVEQQGWPKGRQGSGTTVGIEPEFDGPYGLAVDKNGYIYVTDQMNGRIVRCDSNGLTDSAVWGSFTVNAAQYALRGLCVNDTFLFVMYDDDFISSSGERVWFKKINLSTKVVTSILTNEDWGKVNTDAQSQGEPVVTDLVVESTGNFAYIANPDMTDNIVGLTYNSNTIHKVNINNGTQCDWADGEVSGSGMEYCGLAIDEFDVVYSTNSDGTGDAIGLYKIWRYSDNNPSGLTTEGYRKLGASANGNGNMPFGSGYGSDYNQMGRAEHIVYDKINQCIWVSDMENNRIARYDITYNNSSNLENMIEDLTIENAGDTPNITGYLVYGSNVNYFSSEDQYYCREGMNDTIDILFNKTMSVSDTPVVKLVYEDNYETDVVIHYYSANKLIVLFNIISGHDGIAFFRVSGAKDLFTTGQLNEPDESVKIVVDTQRPEKPVLNISSPYNVTSNPVYPYVTGTVNDRNPLKVSVYTFSNETGSSISYTQQNINLNPDKSFTAISVNLISPSPSENYIGAVCYDKAGNVSETSDLKKINFVNGTPGIASVTPDYDTGYVINTAHSFYIKYTAAENILESCTITFYVPYGWSNPQNVLQTSAGYVNIKDTDSVYNLRINTTSSSDTFFSVTFDSMFSGGYFTLIYGDTLNGNNQNAKTLISNNAVFGQNNFTVIRKKHSSSNEQIQTNDIYVTGQPLRIGFEDKLINTFVFKGQKDVLFGELTFYNDNINKSYKLTSFDIIIKDTQNLGIIPSAVISKLSVKDINASYCLKTSIENSGNKISVVLSENITINPSSSKTVGIYIDIMQTSVSSGFRIFLSDSDSYKVFDAETSGIQLTVSAVNTFDSMYSSACSINSANPATDLYIDYTDYSPDYASYGQAATYIFKLSLSNPVLNSSLIKLKSITFNLTDIAGSGINFSSVINSIALKKSESSLYYSNVSSMPSADSITISLTDFYIQFGDTKYIDLYCTFKNVSAIQSVKFKVSGQSGFNAVDNNLNSGCTVSILPSSSKVFPLISKGTAMQSPNILNKIYTSFDNSQILTGTEFSVNAYFKINSDSAKAVVFPSASDLKFYINNTDSSSEFSILSMSSATVFETGYAGNTITYTCKQNGLSSGNLKVDFIVSKPQGIDFNDYYYGGQSLVLSDSKAYFDTSAVLNIISDSIELVNYSLSNFNVYPDSNGIQVLKFVIKNNQILNDTIVSMIIRKTVSNNGIDTVFVYSDNGNGVYDAADTELANSAFPGNTVSLNINYMIGSLSSKLFFVTVHLSKTLTDGDTFDFEIPANSLYLMSGLTRPATSFNSSGELRAQVSGDRISIYPQEDTVAVGQYVSINLKVTDSFGNTDKDFNNSVTVTLSDETSPTAIVYNAVPGVWDTGDNQATGYLSQGEGNIQIIDTNNEDTVTITPSSIYFSIHQTGTIRFTQSSSATSNIVNSTSNAAGSENIMILDFNISNPVLNDTILSISISSNNTDDSDVKRLKLWVDNGASGFQGLGTDTLIGNSYFVSGTAVFDTDIFENSGLRLFVTYDIDTVVTDNNILDAYINSGGLVLQNAGSLPVSGTINSAGNSSVNVSAVKLVLSSGTSVSSVGDTAALNITASDIYGNRDKNYNSTILSLTNNASAKYVSSTLNSASGIPNGPVTGFLNEGQGIVVCRDSISETVVFTAASSGLASGTQVYYWYNLAGINISMQNYYDTVSQIISVSGTLTNGASGDSVELYVNSALQSSASVNLNQWTGTVSLSGYNDTVSACLIRQSSVIAADTRIINYFGSLSIEITYPNTSSFDTSVNNFEIRGSVLNAGSGDTVNIFVNSVFQSNNVITVLNGNFSGTASISGYYDSITVQIIDKFGRNAFDTITAGYYQAPDVKITFPDSQVYDTCSIEVTISGTAININFGDTVEIFSDTVLNSVISITSLNQQWTGTARLHYPGDSVIIKLSTKFGYTDYDTVSIRLYYPNRLYGFVLLQGRTDNSGCSAVFRSISDTYCAVSDSTGYLILQNIIPGTYNLQLYASAYKIETYNNIVIDTDTVVNSGTLQLSGGDLDMSGNITLDDLSILFYYFGKQVDSPLKGDINNSGWVTEDDYSIIIHNLKE